MNHQITAVIVRLLDADGSQIGIVPINQAHKIAKEKGYDLAEISPHADPPVVKLIDWGKYLYEQDKQRSRNRKKQRSIEVKQTRIGLKIGQHDIEVKQRAVRKFLEAGNKVKIIARFKGREMTRPDLGESILNKFFEGLKDIATIEQKPTITGRDMSMVIAASKTFRNPPIDKIVKKTSNNNKELDNAKTKDI